MSTSSNSGNSTSLYGEAGTPIPDSSGNVIVRGDLYVLSGNILTTATTGNIFPANATTINLGLAATAVNIGAATGTTTINNALTAGGTVTAPGADFGNITIGVATDNTITTTSGDLVLQSASGEIDTNTTDTLSTNSATFNLLNSPTTVNAFLNATSLNMGETTGTTTINNNLTVDGVNINLAPSANFLYSENNNRTNRPEFQSTSGNSSGLRVRAPNTGTSASSTFSVNNSSDSANTEFLSMQARGSALGDTFRILTGEFIANVFNPSNKSISFTDYTNTYATVNPAGPTIGTDLTTKTYVDNAVATTGVTSITGTANQVIASSSTGAVTLSLPQSIGTGNSPTFAGATLGNITVGVATDNTITTTTGDLNITATAASSVNITSETNAPTLITRNSTAVSSSVRSLALAVQSSGTPAAGFGNNLEWQLETAPGNTESAGFISVVSTDVTPTAEDFKMSFGLMQNGATYAEKAFIDSTGSLTLDNDLTIGGNAVNLASGTTIGYNDNDTRANRLQIQSTTGNTTGLRITAPNATTSAVANLTAFSTNDYDNGEFIALQATGSTTAPFSIRTGKFTAGVLGASSEEINITDGGVIYASINPAGPTNSTDLTTKAYVDALPAGGVTSITGTANQVIASSSTGAITLSLPQSIATTSNPTFAGATLDAVTVGVDSAQTISTTSGDLVLQTAAGVNSGTITINSGAAGNIVIAPDTTGDIHLNSDAIRIGDANATATLATRGTGNLVLTTNEGSAVEGTLTFANGANGNATFAPNGTGSVATTFNNGGNITNNRNYVHGAIRNATTRDTNGDIWELNTSAVQSASNPYFRGVSLDNSADTTRGPATLMRSYSGGAVNGSAQRGRVIFEKARGTAASPTAVQSTDILGSIDVTGYTSTGWLNDTIPAVAGFFGFAAAENWVSNTALGTNFTLTLAPTSTTIATAANLTQVLNFSPQSNTYRSDVHTFSQGKTGTTQMLDLSPVRASFTTPVRFPAFLATAVNGTLATTAAAGTGGATGVATLTFGALASAPYTVGSQIIVAGVTPVGFNGTQTVTACTTTTVSYALPTVVGPQTVAGTIKAAGAVGFQISISDSTTNGGRMAYWDTTNNRWNYVSDDTAV